MIGLAYHYLRNTCNLHKGIHPLDWYTFEKQMDSLKKDFKTIMLDDDLDSFFEKKTFFNQKKYLVSFDDGLKEHLTAAKLLKRKGIKAIFAIIGCTTFDNKIPLVHKLHWLRSNIEINLLKKQLEEILGKKFLLNATLLKKAQEMHIHDDPDTAVLKYNLNFIFDYKELNLATSELIKLYIDSEKDFCERYFLSLDEIKQISQLGHIIAWHTENHIPMSKLSKNDIKKDLEIGYEFLNSINSLEEKHLCYPYGRIDALPLKNLDDVLYSKFKYGWTLDNLDNEYSETPYNNLLLQRITTNELFKNDTQLISKRLYEDIK